MESKMKDVAKLLGVSLGQEFKIRNKYNDLITSGEFVFRDDGLYRSSTFYI